MSASEVYSVEKRRDGEAVQIRFHKPRGMTWRDYLISLLHLAAQVEHGLMIQYLYAAYSLGPAGLTEEQGRTVARWQRTILDVAKEEMGHLLTVQNILALLRAPPNFTRAELPFEAALSPIPFVLDPLTKEVAASFTFAEMPPDAESYLSAHDSGLRNGLRKFIADYPALRHQMQHEAESAGSHTFAPQPVALLYDEIIAVIGRADLIEDADFDETSYAAQASWDDWGRNYGPDPRLLSPGGDVISEGRGSGRAHVIVERAATRSQALHALRAITGQGEALHLQHPHKLKRRAAAPPVEEGGEPSHFERFLKIWQHYPSDWTPCRNLMRNPATRPSTARHTHRIENATVLDWALLFNTRYRMLLTFLAHSYRLARAVRPDQPNLRGMVMHRAFGEMYNIKTIALLLVKMKVSAPGEPEIFAGPPFETPYSLNLPAAPRDAWHLHRDLFAGALELNERLQSNGSRAELAYLKSLHELDTAAIRWIDGILGAPAYQREAVT